MLACFLIKLKKKSRKYPIKGDEYGRSARQRAFAPEFSERVVKMLTTCLSMLEQRVLARCQQPWGLKQLIIGKWPNHARQERLSKQESRLRATLNLIALVEQFGMTPKEIEAEINALIEKARIQKEDESD